MLKANIIRQEIIEKTKEYYKEKFSNKESFSPGETKVNYAGRVFDELELMNRKETAEFLRISLPTLYQWTLKGKLPFIKTGRKVWYEKAELVKHLRDRKYTFSSKYY